MARGKHQRSSCFSRVIMFIILMVVLIYPFYEANNLKVKEHTLTASDLPVDLNSVRIVFLSDIHQGAYYSMSKVTELVNKVNALNADLVLLGGDYANDSDGALAFFQNAPRFKARYLVAGVLGNHDRTVPESNLALIQSAMVGAGVLPLVNAVTSVRIGNASISLAGIDDWGNGHPDIAAVAAQCSQDNFTIFLTHSPAALATAFAATDMNGSTRWFDLALCGHTHGGQITLFDKPLLTNLAPEVASRYLTGWIEENRAAVLVSNGVGTSVVPIRIGAEPQIHVITLKAK